jgi:hypothetical protein
VRFTVSDDRYRQFGAGERRIGVGDLIYRIPNLTLALVLVVVGVALLKGGAISTMAQSAHDFESA